MNYAEDPYPTTISGAKTLGANAAMQQAAFPSAISRIEMAAKQASGFASVVQDFTNRVLGEELSDRPERISKDRAPGHAGEISAVLDALNDALSRLEREISRLGRIG